MLDYDELQAAAMLRRPVPEPGRTPAADFRAGIINDIDAQLSDIEHAEARLSNGTFGTCEACGKSIDPERLSARPATRFCIDDQIGVEREVQMR